VKAIILAGGYATRLRPLTDDTSKPLLPVGGRPMIDWILDRVREVGELDEIHVVTNSRFAGDFRRWAESQDGVVVHDDGTTSNEDRLGAIGDIAFTLDASGIDDDDLLVVAGDNLFDYSLADFVAFWRGKNEASVVAVHDVGDLELVQRYSVVELDDDGRIVGFEEKPPAPTTTLAATATYLYHRAHVPLLRRYLEEGNPPDQPGRFVAWLHSRVPVYAYPFEGSWADIGDPAQLLEADNRLRRAHGLPERRAYTIDT
jgi:glucose-1-phosphate thymidylyltransferase